MANKGCNNCEHYKIGEIKMWTADIPSKCLLGNDQEFDQWWIDNGGKTDKNILTDMPCFKETKIGELADKVSQVLDKLHHTVDTNKNEEKP